MEDELEQFNLRLIKFFATLVLHYMSKLFGMWSVYDYIILYTKTKLSIKLDKDLI